MTKTFIASSINSGNKVPTGPLWIFGRIPLIGLMASFLLGGCAKQPEMDFMAWSQGGPSIIHIDKAGYAEARPIDFLQGEGFGHISVRNLNEIAIMANGPPVKYYKNKSLLQVYNLDVKSYPDWLYLLPERNCLLVDFKGSDDERIIRIELDTGNQKSSRSGSNPKDRIFIDISNPLWDKRANNLIVCCTRESYDRFVDGPVTSTSELARMNPDDMAITNLLPITGAIMQKQMAVEKLLDFDSSTNQLLVDCRPRYEGYIIVEGQVPGIYQIDLNTGDSTFITDLHEGDELSNNHAVIAHRYLFSGNCRGTTPFTPAKVFCYDLKNNFLGVWTTFPPKNAAQYAEPYFESVISQDTLHLEGE